MIVPTPPVELEGHCSVIYNNSLYTYSANGFASIPLGFNGTWSQLPMGEPVSNAACVSGLDGSKDQQAMYVIGGLSSSPKPPGVQRYSFKDRTWTTIQSTQLNMGNRTAHSAVYLNSSSSLLVYGGSQLDGSQATSDTFTINTTSYLVQADTGPEPAISPVLLPWSDSEAALVGGQTFSQEIHLFDPVNKWHALGVNLSQPLPSDVRCAIVSRSDGSKLLESFNMNVSPNTVTTVALLNAGGTPANTSTIVGAASPSRKRKRESTLDGYPTYDGQLASSTTRSDYSLAQSDDGLVVISSGGGTDSLTIFNQTSNSWVNTTKLFYGNESPQQILASTATPSPSSSSTPTSTPASSASSGNNNIGVIIGATVGSLVGLATIVILLLSLLHHKKQRRRRAGQGTGGSTDKDRLSFQDQGMGVPLAQSAYPMAKSPVPLRMPTDSVGIFSGEKALRSASEFPSYGQTPTQLKSATQPDGEFNILSDKEIEAQVSTMGGQPGDRRTDEGWGKYFQDDNTRSLVGMQSEANTASRLQSEAKTNAWPMNTLAPLNFGFLDEPKPLGGRVVSGSPTTENGSANGRNLTRAESLSARISSISAASEESDYDHDPNSQAAAQHSWLGRPPSSTYSKTYSNNRDTMNTRGSSILILDNLEPPQPARNNVNSDMSWLNLNSDR